MQAECVFYAQMQYSRCTISSSLGSGIAHREIVLYLNMVTINPSLHLDVDIQNIRERVHINHMSEPSTVRWFLLTIKLIFILHTYTYQVLLVTCDQIRNLICLIVGIIMFRAVMNICF